MVNTVRMGRMRQSPVYGFPAGYSTTMAHTHCVFCHKHFTNIHQLSGHLRWCSIALASKANRGIARTANAPINIVQEDEMNVWIDHVNPNDPGMSSSTYLKLYCSFSYLKCIRGHLKIISVVLICRTCTV
jgi:hypothetical protein